jgi:hypothetical protein
VRRILAVSDPVLAAGLAEVLDRKCLAGRVVVQRVGYRGECGRP